MEKADNLDPQALLEVLFSPESRLSSQKSKAILSKLTVLSGKRLLEAASNPSEEFLGKILSFNEIIVYTTQLCNELSIRTVVSYFKENLENGPFLCTVINRMSQNKVNQVLGFLNAEECGQILAFCQSHSQNERIINTKKLKDIFQSMK